MQVLVFFAHPDDETMLAGGTLALLNRSGANIHYLLATRGEGGEVGDPPVCSPDLLGSVREEELACAVQALGGGSLDFLDYIDPRVGPGEELYAYTDDVDALADRVAAYIRKSQAEILFTHGSNGEYGHPAHQLSHRAALMAVQSLGAGAPRLYTVSAAFPAHPRPFLTNQDDLADIVVDTTAALEQKTQAALCHRSQHALFVRRASEEAGHPVTVPEVIIPLEGLHRVLPAGEDQHDDPVARLLGPWMVPLERTEP